MDVRDENGRRMSRVDNLHWQQALRDYLLSGDAVIIIRAKDAEISASTWDAITGGGILAADGAHVVYRVESGRH